MKILILGSGGREHCFARQIAQSPLLEKLFIAPGNAGTSECGTNVEMDILAFDDIKRFVIDNAVNLVLVGPEDPLVNGIYDYFQVNEELKSVSVIGPGKDGAKLEGSKDFAKLFMAKHNVPTAAYKTFTKFNLNDGLQFLETLSPPYVLKADGLAAGKGVIILEELIDAKAALTDMLENEKFGIASSKVVVEEFLKGIELSVFVLTDGNSYKILPTAKDYKRIGDGDTGLNTGGMGAISPVPFADAAFMKKVEEKIVIPSINGLKAEQIPYKGFLFIGLMNVGGEPYVIEYNVRMGDPETEVVLHRIKSDFIEILDSVAKGTLAQMDLEIDERIAATVVLASGGYPEQYEKGKEISGLYDVKDSIVFHAGTLAENGTVVTNGGRVMAITSLGVTLKEAIEKSYSNAAIIDFEGKYYRKDIGRDLEEVLN